MIKLSLHSLGAIMVMLGLSVGFSYLLSSLLGLEFLPVLLAFAPGGVAEMCLIALVLNIDPAFVALHHLVRITFILLAAPLMGKLIQHYRVTKQS